MQKKKTTFLLMIVMLLLNSTLLFSQSTNSRNNNKAGRFVEASLSKMKEDVSLDKAQETQMRACLATYNQARQEALQITDKKEKFG